MKRTKKEKEAEHIEAAVFQGAVVVQEEPKATFDFDTFKLTTLADFDIYNAEVRKHNRKCLHERNKMKIKVPDESYHKKVKIKFNRFEQPENILKARIRTKEIDWKGQLKPGGIYDLPIPVVKYLNALAVPIFSEVKVDSNGVKTETQQVGERARFSCSVLEFA